MNPFFYRRVVILGICPVEAEYIHGDKTREEWALLYSRYLEAPQNVTVYYSFKMGTGEVGAPRT